MVGSAVRERLSGSWMATVPGLMGLCLLVSACGLDETYTGMGSGALPGDPLNPIPVEATVDIQLDIQCVGPGNSDVVEEPESTPMDLESLEGYAYRFTSLALSKPLSGTIGQGLNDFFAKEIGEGRLHVLLKAFADDREAGTLLFKIGAGGVSGSNYQYSGTPGDLMTDLYGGHFVTAEPSFLAFPNSLLTPPELPISNLELEGVIAADGSGISQGVLVGALTLEDAKGITLMGSTFDKLLESMKVNPDLDLDDDGTADAYSFKGTFEATAVTVE